MIIHIYTQCTVIDTAFTQFLPRISAVAPTRPRLRLFVHVCIVAAGRRAGPTLGGLLGEVPGAAAPSFAAEIWVACGSV